MKGIVCIRMLDLSLVASFNSSQPLGGMVCYIFVNLSVHATAYIASWDVLHYVLCVQILHSINVSMFVILSPSMRREFV